MSEKENKTKFLQLHGIFEWAKVFEETRDMIGANGAYEACDGACTLDLIVTPDVYQQLADTGSQKSPLILDKNGKWRGERTWSSKEQGKSFLDALEEADQLKVKLVRKWKAPHTYGGAPQVAHVDGSAWSLQEDGLIGNGSKGIAYVSVYEAKGLVGTRLDGVQVLEHVVYDNGGDDTGAPTGPRFKDYTADTPKAVTKAKAAPKKAELEEDSEIPF